MGSTSFSYTGNTHIQINDAFAGSGGFDSIYVGTDAWNDVLGGATHDQIFSNTRRGPLAFSGTSLNLLALISELNGAYCLLGRARTDRVNSIDLFLSCRRRNHVAGQCALEAPPR
ncbi:hypothetical protein IV102_23560 [bacterium]|nr:hypothetical protein [bacterium]